MGNLIYIYICNIDGSKSEGFVKKWDENQGEKKRKLEARFP